jgi:hypothetical protein
LRKLIAILFLMAFAAAAAWAQTTIYNIDQKTGWQKCSNCAGVNGSTDATGYFTQYVGTYSMDGKGMKFFLGGTTPYRNALWSVNLNGGTSAHHFVYDTYFYINNGGVSQALEFDINQYVNGHQLIWGTQCNIRGGNHWDIYDNQNWHWVSTGIYCGAPSSYTWHHVVLEVARATDGSDRLHYISITLDGNKHYLDWWMAPTSSSWNVATVNFQMDIDGSRDPYAVWLDKLNVTYW